MNIEEIFSELEERWGYDRMVLEDIRDTLEEFGHSCYIQGYLDKTAELKHAHSLEIYGKKEDREDYYDFEP